VIDWRYSGCTSSVSMTHELHCADCLDVLRTLPDASVNAIVTDPPYGLSFMGKKWDYDVPTVEVWTECLRVLKPGGHLLAFAGTRTQHRMAVRIEDAGFEIRDMIAWVYGSGFPKSLDVSKAIDKAAGAEREVVGAAVYGEGHVQRNSGDSVSGYSGGLTTEGEGIRTITAPATPEAQQWAGWGTALKPALEPITVARKPLGTVGVNVLARVECELRKLGIQGDILWKEESASGAAKAGNLKNLSSTVRRQTGATSAESADVSVIPNGEKPCGTISGQNTQSGERQTATTFGNMAEKSGRNSETKCSTSMGQDAHVAEKPKETFSQSTTLKEEGPLTENQSTERFTSNSSATGSRPATEFFAGIATGLTGSMAHVHIKRDREGFFWWPARLPKSVPGSPLTVAANVLAHGTGGINVDGCRVSAGSGDFAKLAAGVEAIRKRGGSMDNSWKNSSDLSGANPASPLGRWPANLIHDGSDDVMELFPESNSARVNGNPNNPKRGSNHVATSYGQGNDQETHDYRDSGSAARFFYCAKASKRERGEGNTHPTVKPIALMRYLCRLVTPPGGTVLDPFMGSGSTGIASIQEGFNFVGVERDADYMTVAERRIAAAVCAMD
jgi:hypothetical protein